MGNMEDEDKDWHVDSFVLALMTNSLIDFFLTCILLLRRHPGNVLILCLK